jgi:hypothetical protein
MTHLGNQDYYIHEPNHASKWDLLHPCLLICTWGGYFLQSVGRLKLSPPMLKMVDIQLQGNFTLTKEQLVCGQ